MGSDKNKYDKYENYKSSWIKIDNGDLELIEPISVKRFVFPNDNGFYIEILLNNKIVGGFHCYYDEDEGQMNDTEILPEYRNIGLGKILLLKAIELSNGIFGGFSSDVRGLTKEQEQVYRSLNKDGALVNWGEINYKRAQEVIDLISEKLNNRNLQENIKRILKEESKIPLYIRRRFDCIDRYINRLEQEPGIIPIGRELLSWEHYQIIVTAYIRDNCGDDGYYNENLHNLIMDVFGERLYEWFKKNG